MRTTFDIDSLFANLFDKANTPRPPLLERNSKILNRLKKRFRLEGYDIKAWHNMFIVSFPSYSVTFRLDTCNYIRVRRLPLTGVSVSLNGSYDDILIKLCRYPLFDPIDLHLFISGHLFYYRNISRAYDNGSPVCFLLVSVTGASVTLRRNNGQHITYSLKSFRVLLTRQPTYLKTKQLKLL